LSAYQLPIWVWPTALLGVCGVAALRGRDDERLAAGGYLASWALTLVVFKERSADTQWGVLVVDLALLGLLVWVSMRSRRYWPLFATSFHLLAVVTHLARALDPQVGGWSYLTVELIWSYMVIGTIGYGAWTAPQYYPAKTPTPTDAPVATRR
jgi:hypothetical protein